MLHYGNHSLGCLFKKSNDLFSPDRREAFQKIVDGFSAFKVIDQGLNRHPGSGKDRRAAHYIRR